MITVHKPLVNNNKTIPSTTLLLLVEASPALRWWQAAGEAQTQTTDSARTFARLTFEPNVSLCLGRNVVIQWKKEVQTTGGEED